jgi:hypothetical protein
MHRQECLCYLLASQAVVFVGYIRRVGSAVVDIGELVERVIAVVGGVTPGPGAGLELAVGVVVVGGAVVVGIDLVGEDTGGCVVLPFGGVGAAALVAPGTARDSPFIIASFFILAGETPAFPSSRNP